MCDARAAFIERIFSLEHASQTMLKALIENAMSRTSLIGNGEDEGQNPTGVSEGEEAVRQTEMVRHLQAERQRLVTEVERLERATVHLTTELTAVKEDKHQLQQQLKAASVSGAGLGGDQQAAVQRLEEELAEARRENDLLVVEIGSLNGIILFTSYSHLTRLGLRGTKHRCEAHSSGMRLVAKCRRSWRWKPVK